MRDIKIIPVPKGPRTWWNSSTARWLVTFTGFPLGGFAATLIVGPVDNPGSAVLGGLITGSVLGAVQAWGLGPHRPPAGQWIAATALGLMAGLGVAAAAVDYESSLTALLGQGAICGLAVGAAQALVLRRRIGRLAVAWPFALAAAWATGWAVTHSIGVRVEEQFVVFGASGALVVTALTAVLPFVLNRHARRRGGLAPAVRLVETGA
ncbi:MAG: hypothetical protein QOE53_660 [Pseudonocardiales bacterium]|jgi:hypothetical protein|nr:hypothetical protein [Pseudonocardiales bacterium]